MVQLDNKIHRVFFHELGHYVAQLINLKHYNGFGVSKIFVKPHGVNEYCGGTTLICPPGVDKIPLPTKEVMIESIFGLEHGCIFECYLLKTNIGDCANTHGGNDYASRYDFLNHHEKLDFRIELSSSIDEYLGYLIDNEILEEFVLLNPEEYFLHAADEILINLEKLKDNINPIIERYYPTYKNEYEKLSEIIEMDIK